MEKHGVEAKMGLALFAQGSDEGRKEGTMRRRVQGGLWRAGWSRE